MYIIFIYINCICCCGFVVVVFVFVCFVLFPAEVRIIKGSGIVLPLYGFFLDIICQL